MCLRALETNEPLERYLLVKAEIERLTDALSALKPLITEALQYEPEQKTLFLGCEITLGRRKTYEYSEALQVQERALKEAKRLERLTGEAVVLCEVFFPVVTPVKAEAA